MSVLKFGKTKKERHDEHEKIFKKIENIEDLLPLACLKNINVYEEYKGEGYGKEIYEEYENWAKYDSKCSYSLLVVIQ